MSPRSYALGGREPRSVLRPSTLEEAGAALAAAARDRLKVVPWGGGTRIGGAAPPERYDLALDLSGLDRIVEYDPEDFTLTAQCGATLATLRSALAARGQELPLETPLVTRATLGGTLALNASGPRRLRFGAPHDRILGARIALADGTLVRSGGKVVKNVAGFALHRLLCGSEGRLALILEASLKLAPAPEARAALIYGAAAADLADAARWSFLPRLEPAFVTVLGAGPARDLPAGADSRAPFTVAIGLEDDAAWVAEQERTVIVRLGTPAARLEGPAEAALVQALADAENHAPSRLTFTSAHNTVAALGPLAAHAGAARLVCHAPAGRLHWFPDPGGAPGALPDFHSLGYRPIRSAGGARIEPAIPPEVGTLALRTRIREALDPHGALERS